MKYDIVFVYQEAVKMAVSFYIIYIIIILTFMHSNDKMRCIYYGGLCYGRDKRDRH